MRLRIGSVLLAGCLASVVPLQFAGASGVSASSTSEGSSSGVRVSTSSTSGGPVSDGLTSPAELRRILATDDTAYVHSSGRLAYADVFADPPASERAVAAAMLPESQTVTLHSRPGSKRTIFLDFDGANVSNTAWNGTADDEIPNGNYTGYSQDGDLGTFNPDEHTYIQEVWRLVSETYATFDVDVTTEDPGPGAYNRSGGGDYTYGDHVLFSDDLKSTPICSGGCGGVAFVGTFADPDDNVNYFEPAWVRSFNTPFAAAMAASHEIGHTLGLKHDGRISPEEAYYEGHGAWTPIMGAGEGAIHQFSKGEYASANNKQDDFAVMIANGLPRLYDEAGNTQATATTLGARATYAVNGVISSASDVDIYKIGPCTSAPKASATGSGSGSALDLSVNIIDTANVIRASSNPPSGQNPGNPNVAFGMDTNQTTSSTGSGTYYVKVDGVGQGNPATTGYSDYGSVGTYALAISGCVASDNATPGAPTGVALANSKNAGTVSWNAPAPNGSSAITGYRISGLPSGPVEVPAGTLSKGVTVAGGTDLTIRVIALNSAGGGTPGTLTKHIASWAPTAAPTVRVTTKVLTATITWTPAPNPGGAGISEWRLTLLNKTFVLRSIARSIPLSFSSYGRVTATLKPVVVAENGSTAPSRTFSFVVAVNPYRPAIGTAVSGAKGKPVTATARWRPASDGGSAITSYKVVAAKVNGSGTIVRTYTKTVMASLRSYAFKLPAGRYKFKVSATNIKGTSPASKYSLAVSAR